MTDELGALAAEAAEVRGTGFFINGAVQDVSFGMEHLLEGVEAVLQGPIIRL